MLPEEFKIIFHHYIYFSKMRNWFWLICSFFLSSVYFEKFSVSTLLNVFRLRQRLTTSFVSYLSIDDF